MPLRKLRETLRKFCIRDSLRPTAPLGAILALLTVGGSEAEAAPEVRLHYSLSFEYGEKWGFMHRRRRGTREEIGRRLHGSLG